MSMNELDLGRLLKSFCGKNGIPLKKEINLLKLLADVGGVAENLYKKNQTVNASIKAITGEDSMMVCPNCGSHVIVEYKTCIACGEELYEGAAKAQKATTVSPDPVEAPKSETKVEYPTVAEINKMKKPALEELVDMLGLEIDMEGKLADIRKAVKAEIKELKTLDKEEPVKASEEEVEDEDALGDDTLDDLEEEELEDETEFEEEDDEESLEDDVEEEELEDEEDLEEEELEDETEEDDLDEEDLEEEVEDEGLDEDFEEEELDDDLEEDETEEELDDEFEEEDLEDDLEEEDVEDELEEEDLEEDLESEFEDEEDEEEIEEPAPKKKVTKKKVAKKASKKVTKKVAKKATTKKKVAKKPALNDQKAEREKKKLALKKKIPSLVKNPANLSKLEHSERVSLQSMLGEEQGNKKPLAELKGEAMIKQLKKQLVIWKKKNAKK